MLRNRLLAGVAAFALASAQVSSGIAALPSPNYQTAPDTGNTNLGQAATMQNLLSRLSHVLNASLLATVTNYAIPVMRDDVGILYADTGASCTAADGYAQVQPATGHCWKIVAGSRYNLRIWGATGGNDSAAWVAALAYLGNLGGTQELYDDIPGSTIAQAARVTIPTNVTVRGAGEYETIASLAAVYFSQSTSGFTMQAQSGLSNIAVVDNSGKADHLIEVGGNVAVSKLVCAYYLSCIRNSTTITTTASGASVRASTDNTANTGFTNGTYNGVAFTSNSAGSGATVNVVVSGGSISTVTFATGGTGYLPWFDYNFAAGALYSGSPAINVVGQIDTVNTGRSVFHDIFLESLGTGSANTGIGLENDGAYDFVDIDNVEAWSPNGIQGTGYAFRFGHVDGLSLKNPKCFGIYLCIEWSAPTTTVQSFGSIVGAQLDGVTIGMDIKFPLTQLSITGGYTRALGKPLYVSSPGIQLAISGHSYYTLSDNINLADFGQISMTGNTFASGTIYNPAGGTGTTFSELYIGNGGTQSGAGNFFIGSNTFDGNVPAITLDSSTKGGLVGPNRWPGRKYAATYNSSATAGYITNANTTTNVVQPVVGGQITLSTNSSGQVTIPWTLGYSPQQVSVATVGSAAANGYRAAVTSIGSESMTVQVFTAAGAAAASGVSVTIAWSA